MFDDKNVKSNYLSNEYNFYNHFYFCQITDQSAQQLRALVWFLVQSQNCNNEPWNRRTKQLGEQSKYEMSQIVEKVQKIKIVYISNVDYFD